MSSRAELEALIKARLSTWKTGDQSRLLPLGAQQALYARPRPAKGQIWLSQVTLPAPPEDDIRQTLFDCIECLNAEQESYTQPMTASVQAEWIGYRPGVSATEPEPAITEKEKLSNLVRACTRDLTIFYVHGGGFFIGSASASRSLPQQLTRLTGGKCFSTNYRLAPDHPFPAALLDVLTAYFSLLYPPPDAFHDPVDPSKIVLAGDSAGANLCVGLVRVILHMQKTNRRAMFHGQLVSNVMPAGITCMSSWFDYPFALPSKDLYKEYDVLTGLSPPLRPNFTYDEHWPSSPPRGDVYCETNALCHVLVSPVIAPSWQGFPPMWLAVGEERLADGSRVVAQQAYSDRTTVVYEEYEKMCHVFAMFYPGVPQTALFFEHWADACLRMVGRKFVKSRAVRITLELGTEQRDIRRLVNYSREETLDMLKKARDARPLITRPEIQKASM